MALDFSDAKRKSLDITKSSDLKKMLNEKQRKIAENRFYKIRDVFKDQSCPLTMDDDELIELIKIKVLKRTLVKGF